MKLAKASLVMVCASLMAVMLALPALAQQGGDGYPVDIDDEVVVDDDVVVDDEVTETVVVAEEAAEAAVLGRVLAVTGGSVTTLVLGGLVVLLLGGALLKLSRRGSRSDTGAPGSLP
jgi:hypothetical protein